jgi:NAD(P)H-hydrate epimerase
VIPVATTAQMKAVDEAAAEPVEVLIGRAGWAVARAARRLLGGAYGRRVVVVAGKGNNGADGKAAARWLAGWGVRVTCLDAASAPDRLPPADLVIDAAYGTGFRGSYVAPDPCGAPVLAVDIPSGLAGDTGLPGEGSEAVRAVATVTFAAYKPGLLLGEGPSLGGAVEVADIGLGPGVDAACNAWLLEDADASRWLLPRTRDSHKWRTAVVVAAGSPGMMGAPALVSRAAMRAGAGYVLLGVPGASLGDLPHGEAVGLPLAAEGWDGAVLEAASRCKAVVTGPGLGRAAAVRPALLGVVGQSPVPVVVDGDGLTALAPASVLGPAVAVGSAPVVITPHEGEYARLFGAAPSADRLAAVRAAAAGTGAIVLLKGPTTIVAAPDGRCLVAAAGSPRLATAGTGDVLSGMIGAFIARGVPPFEAAGLAAHVHGRAAGLGRREGLVSGDLPELVAGWLSGLPR